MAVSDDGCRKATEIAAIRKIDTLREKHFYAVVRIRILKHKFSGDSCGDPPVPMPNTAVKAANAESTWGEAPWEDRKPLIKQKEALANASAFFYKQRSSFKGAKATNKTD